MPDYSADPSAGGDAGGGEGDSDYSDAQAPVSEPDAKEEQSEESPKGLLPKSILMGKDFKPGDEIVLKIDAIHDDEVEVSYASEKGGEGKSDYGEAPPAGDKEMASMME